MAGDRDIASSRALKRRGGQPGLAPGSARSLLLTILGELVWPADSTARTSALLYVMKGLNVEERTARQAIARAAASDWITPERRGREVSWSLTDHIRHVFEEGSRRVSSLGDPIVDWDGTWLVLLITIPESRRSVRKSLYAGLAWAGLGNPSPGVWLSPHAERGERISTLIESLGLHDYTMSFVGSAGSVGLAEKEIVQQGWDLDALADRYSTLYKKIRNPHPKPGDDTLLFHITLLNEWQQFPYADPQLPEALVPNWIGRRVSTHIEQLRRRWSDEVHGRWAEINGSP